MANNTTHLKRTGVHCEAIFFRYLSTKRSCEISCTPQIGSEVKGSGVWEEETSQFYPMSSRSLQGSCETSRQLSDPLTFELLTLEPPFALYRKKAQQNETLTKTQES
jgi:hypothetical protein